MTCSGSLVQIVLRLISGYVKVDLKKFCKRCCKKNQTSDRRGNRESLLNDFGLVRQVTKAQEFEWLEQRVLETVSFFLNFKKYEIFFQKRI
jgi:hypothetical protein